MPKGSVHQDVMLAIYRAAQRELGEQADAAFAGMNLGTRVPIDEAQAMWARMAALDDDGTLGTRLGRDELYAQGVMSLLYLAAGAQSTMARALRILSRYYALISSSAELSISIVGEGENREYRIRSLYGAGARPNVVSQSTLIAILDGIRGVCAGPTPILRVHFAAPMSKDVCERLEKFYGAPVVGGAGEDSLFFAPDLGSRPLARIHSEMGARLEAAAERALAAVDTTSVFQEEVVKEIQTLLPEAPTVEAIASRLALTRRSFQRRLKKEGVSFRDLCVQTRVEIARGYLRAGGSVGNVAFLVGYSDATTFSRAYRKAKGYPPVEDTVGANQRK